MSNSDTTMHPLMAAAHERIRRYITPVEELELGALTAPA